MKIDTPLQSLYFEVKILLMSLQHIFPGFLSTEMTSQDSSSTTVFTHKQRGPQIPPNSTLIFEKLSHLS
jgi:hypothetical protein